MLVVFSDGIFEAPCPTGEQFGVERVLEILKDKCGSNATSGEIVAAMREAVTKWQGQDTPADDQTTVIVRKIEVPAAVTGTPEEPAAAAATPV
jgi:serine phosphatase RsbU (regulator of sigma subunit)